jgi:hypothetical protein
MKFYYTAVIPTLLLTDQTNGQTAPPKCTKIKSINGVARSQWILPGEPLPPHWAEFLDQETCVDGPMLMGNCNIGDITGIGYYMTAETTNAGYAADIFPAVGVKSDAKDSFYFTDKGMVLK